MGEHPRPSINARLKGGPFASFLVPQDSRDDAESREAVVDALDAWVFIGAAQRIRGSVLGCREICDGEGEKEERYGLQLDALFAVRARDFGGGRGGRDVEPRVERRALAYIDEERTQNKR